MYRILVVAEKEYQRRHLICKIRKLCGGVEMIQEADDENTALELMDQGRPDVVFIDGCLSDRGAFSCIQRGRERLPHSSFVIVNDSAKISELQEAIRAGAEDYLLRPVNNEELKAALDRAAGKKKEGTFYRAMNDGSELSLEEKSGRWRAAVEKGTDLKGARRIADDMGTEFVYPCISILAVVEASFRKLEEEPCLDKLINYIICNTLREISGGRARCEAMVSEDLSCVYVILNHELSREEEDGLLRRALEILKKELSFACRVGVYSAASDAQLLDELFGKARRLLLETVSLTDRNIVYEEDLDLVQDARYVLRKETFSAVSNLLQSTACSEEEINEYIREIFEDFTVNKYSYASICEACQNIYRSVTRFFNENIQEREHVEDAWVAGKAFTDCRTIEDIQYRFVQQLLNLHVLFDKINSSEGMKIISKIKARIKAEYNRDLKLSTLAAEYYMNQSYLSALFQQETGIGFSQYLTKVRLEKAKELLKTTSLPTGKIASMVGYNDRNYFASVFSKHEGVTPMQYRSTLQ